MVRNGIAKYIESVTPFSKYASYYTSISIENSKPITRGATLRYKNEKQYGYK